MAVERDASLAVFPAGSDSAVVDRQGAGVPPWLSFFISIGAVVPLAAVIAAATSQAALTKDPRVGGLLNATFGNVPDLLIGYFGVRAGLLTFVKATLVGAIISNTALIVGLAFIAAGIRDGYTRFDAREVGGHTGLMLLAVGGMLLPSITAATVRSTPPLISLSVGVAIILLVAYVAYLAFSVFGLIGGPTTPGDPAMESDVIESTACVLEEQQQRWPFWLSVIVLLAAAGALAPVTGVLVASVTPTIRVLGWTEAFVGVIFVANAGNAAEMYSAVAMGTRGRLNLSLEVASGSSIQIATFIAPLLVLLSLPIHPMDLVFSPLELAIVGLVVAIFAYVAHDGEANWLEGAQLVAIYLMAAAVFYVLPRL